MRSLFIMFVVLAPASAAAQIPAAPDAPCVERPVSADATPAPATGAAPNESATALADREICKDVTAPPEAPTEASAALEVTLAEARRRAANLKFEVGPPPRNLTKGETAASPSIF
jgi:hypothetical protein